MSEKDGGPAFPPVHNPETHPSGMTLRDYFAGIALQGMLSSDSSIDRTKIKKDVWARVAYAFADAMLKARSE